MAQLQIRDLSPAFGAEVVGLEGGAELDAEARARLRQAFDERGLLVFRDLDIDRDYQTYVADLLIGYDRPAEGGQKNEMLVSNKEPDGYAPSGRLHFHSDMMWAPEPFQVLSLYGVHVDAPVVPTNFASTTAAWKTLPSDLRAQVEGRRALHVTGQQRPDPDDEMLEAIREREVSTETAIAHPHPRTGQMMLYVSQMNTREVVGLAPDESEELLQELFAHLYGPENSWDHEWRKGDLVAWDNLATQHARGVVRSDGPVRTLRKVISPIPSLKGIEVPKFSEAKS
jgi:alpha-ketoglutarate-dependent taurine dioxygenase